MMSSFRPRSLAIVLVGVFLVSTSVSIRSAAAQEKDSQKIRGKVIGQLWHTKVNGGQFFEYTRNLTQELELPQSPLTMMMGGGRLGGELMNSMGHGQGENNSSKADQKNAQRDTTGSLIFLESSPQPGTPRLVSFRAVKDIDEYKKIIQSQTMVRFGGAELIGKDDRHEVRLNLQSMTNFVPRNIDEGEADGENGEGTEPRQMSFSIRIGTTISETDGSAPETPPEMPTNFSTYYRYHDGFMYSGQMEAIHWIDLPAGKTLAQTDAEAATDIRGRVDLSEIPTLLKQQLWLSLQTRAMTYLQRFDNENAEDHAMRSAMGKGRLELLKAAMFDVDQISFSIQLAKEVTEPIKFDLQVEARKASQLAKALASISKTPSSLRSLRESDSPLMLATTVDLPDWLKPLAINYTSSLQTRMKSSTNDEAVAEIIDLVFQPISDTLQNGLLDGVVRMQGDAATGSTVVGGIKLQNAQNFQTALETLMVVQPASDDYQISQSKAGDQSVLTLSAMADFESNKTSIPVTVHLAGQGGYLWFAIGGATSLEELKKQLGNVSETIKSAGAVRPLEVRLKLSEWLGSESEEFSQMPKQLLQQLERSLSSAFDLGTTMSISMNGEPQKLNTENKFESFAAKVLTEEGSDLDLSVTSTGQRLKIEAEIGTQVVKFLVAQYVAAQNRMFSNIKFDMMPAMGGGLGDGEPGEGGTQIRSIRIGR